MMNSIGLTTDQFYGAYALHHFHQQSQFFFKGHHLINYSFNSRHSSRQIFSLFSLFVSEHKRHKLCANSIHLQFITYNVSTKTTAHSRQITLIVLQWSSVINARIFEMLSSVWLIIAHIEADLQQIINYSQKEKTTCKILFKNLKSCFKHYNCFNYCFS